MQNSRLFFICVLPALLFTFKASCKITGLIPVSSAYNYNIYNTYGKAKNNGLPTNSIHISPARRQGRTNYNQHVYKNEINLAHSESVNLRPIIGVLAEDIPNSKNLWMLKARGYTSYIAASYIKFLEAAGARVAPIFLDQDEAYYSRMANSLNGFLFPGGGADITAKGLFGTAGKILYGLALEKAKKGRPIPIFGTCLGFEMLALLVAGEYPLEPCLAQNRDDPIFLESGYERSRFFSGASKSLVRDLTTKNITANFHKDCLTKKKFYELKLNESLDLLSKNYDDRGVEYVSTFEHRHLPFYGTQWHPEKALFEWTQLKNHASIPHQFEAVKAAQYVANFYVNEARKNTNKFASTKEEDKALIYNYNPLYFPTRSKSIFEQCYYFH